MRLIDLLKAATGLRRPDQLPEPVREIVTVFAGAEQLAKLAVEIDKVAGRPLWLERNYTEPRVNYALHDIVKGGWTVYDVGANFGGLSVAMSRLVGPRGAVCAFEANPDIAIRCLHALIRSGCFNTQVYHAAIYKRSHELIELFLSDNAVADSIYRKTGRSISVPTVALDDFVAQSGLLPELVKMDIEGAEPDALLGFERTIDRCHPIFVLEQIPEDAQCFDLLLAKGYEAIDLQDYRKVRSHGEMDPQTIVTDVLFALPEKLSGTAYAGDLSSAPVATVSGSDFSWITEKQMRSKTLELRPGRYIARLAFSAATEADTMCGIWDETRQEAIVRAHAGVRALVGFARQMVFDHSGGSVSIFFHFISDPDPTLSVETVEISRIPAFDSFRSPFSMG